MLPTEFQVEIGLSVHQKRKIDFQDGCHLGFFYQNDLSYFIYTSQRCFLRNFKSIWPLGSGGDVKNGFSRWPQLRPSWISDRNDFSYFWSISRSDASYQVSRQLALRFIRSETEIFKTAILDFWSERFSDLHVTLMLSTKFQVSWTLGSGGEAKRDFQDACHSSHLGFPIWLILINFNLQVAPMLPTKFQANLPFGSRENFFTEKNRFSRWLP